MDLFCYKNFSSLPARIFCFLSRCGLIGFLLAGSIFTAGTGNIAYMIWFVLASVLFFIVFQKISVHFERKFSGKNGYKNRNQMLFQSTDNKLRGKYQINDHVSLTDWVTFGSDIDLINTKKGIRKAIIRNHEIVDFPGLDHEEEWEKYWSSKQKLQNRVHYRTEFHAQPDGKIKMIWQIQPDGRYWADEGGFGMENDDEINLFSILDDRGRFLQPFRYYNGNIL